MDFKKKYISPVGTALPYCYLQKPDFGNDTIGIKERGEYKVELSIPKDDKRCQRMVDLLSKAYEENYENHKANSTKRVKKADIENTYYDDENGNIVFKFKCYGSFKDKNGNIVEITPMIVDSKGRPMKDRPAISGGSKLKVQFSIRPYNSPTVGAGLKLQLESMMLVELVEYQAGAGEWGEEAVDGGFTADDSDSDFGTDDFEGNDEDFGDF